MKVRTGIFVLVMAAASATWAQSAPTSTVNDTRKLAKGAGNATGQTRENPAKEPAVSGSGGQTAQATTHAAGKIVGEQPSRTQLAKTTTASLPKPMKASYKPKTSAVNKTNATPKPGNVAEAKLGSAPVHVRGHRDPFETVIRSETVETGCATGKKCLDVNKIDLKGIVRSQAGMIAVVENQQRKTYFLRENDPVFKGHVVKINPDSVVFQQNVVDKVGRQSTRDVVKRLFGSAV
jgi:hypothetical protein